VTGTAGIPEEGHHGLNALSRGKMPAFHDDFLETLHLKPATLSQVTLGYSVREDIQGAAIQVEYLIPYSCLARFQCQNAQRGGTGWNLGE